MKQITMDWETYQTEKRNSKQAGMDAALECIFDAAREWKIKADPSEARLMLFEHFGADGEKLADMLEIPGDAISKGGS